MQDGSAEDYDYAKVYQVFSHWIIKIIFFLDTSFESKTNFTNRFSEANNTPIE